MDDYFDRDVDYHNPGENEHEWLNEYYEDNYPEVFNQDQEQHHVEDEDFLSQGGVHPYSFQEILEHCVQPTVVDGFWPIGKVLLCCLIFRVLTQTGKVPAWFAHLTSSVLGLIALAFFFQLNVLYIVGLSLTSYLALYTSHKILGAQRGLLATAACIIFNTAGELFIAEPQDWHQIRGPQMILTMKAISLGFDMDDVSEMVAVNSSKKSEIAESDKQEAERSGVRRRFRKKMSKESTESEEHQENDLHLTLPSVIEYLGYTLCPGNSLFGPWIQYHDYVRMFHEPNWSSAWLLKILRSIIPGFVFLVISTCWNPWFIPDGSWIWWTAYRDAASFRASHYFISYVSEATCVTSGIGRDKTSGEWTITVTQPLEMELPRSLNNVVKYWNIPMHNWLKNYCFKPSRRFGVVPAILTTYFASTMLHGLNFQLAAVLLSLGLYTYAELLFRSKLANIFNASICSTSKEGFRHKEGELLVKLVNFGFGLLACFNLAYLGVLFNQEKIMEEGYSWKHTLAVWANFGYSSHWIMCFILILSKVI